MSKTIGVVGTRKRDTESDLSVCFSAVLEIYEPGDTFVSGGCPKGGDRFCEIIASRLKAPIVIHRAEWSKYGRGAGFQRNTLIARDCDVLVAVVSPDRKGGTEDTIRKARKMGKRIILR